LNCVTGADVDGIDVELEEVDELGADIAPAVDPLVDSAAPFTRTSLPT